jgi:predicted ABC-type ATPase
MANDNKIAIFYGGTNGSGKSSLRIAEMEINIKHIDPDAIAKAMNPLNVRSADGLAGREAIRQFKECLNNKTPFSLESTLSGKSSIRRIHEAKAAGFYVELRFIGLHSPILNVQRIFERVKNGGHHIDDTLVYKRYDECLNNLQKILPYTDKATIFDNSKTTYQAFLTIEQRKISQLNEHIPTWIKQVQQEYISNINNIYAAALKNQTKQEAITKYPELNSVYRNAEAIAKVTKKELVEVLHNQADKIQKDGLKPLKPTQSFSIKR